MKLAGLLSIAVVVCSALAHATTVSKPAAAPSSGPSLLPGGNSKDPVSIEADKLVYFDKEQKAIYSGSVVVIQGDTKLTCSIMTIYMEKTAPSDAGASTPAAAPSPTPTKVAASNATASAPPTRHRATAAESSIWTAPVP